MPSLSENEIKAAFLPFLREFYRFRYEYQPDTERATLDNITREGYIADGMLQFLKPDGTPFTCTYEATSADKIGELKFSLNHGYFLWDCIAFSLLATAVVMGWMYVTNVSFIAHLSTAGKIGLPLGMSLIAFFVWYFSMMNWKKYRHIFAIEQFKRYHADEQWVAMAEDVFPAPTNPFFLELKDQCIYNGIGLAIVYPDRQVRMMVAPSRLGVFGGNRRMVHWITDTQLYQSMASNVKAAAAYQSPISGPLTQLRHALMRPVRRYLLQPLQTALGKRAQPATEAYKQFTETYLIQKGVAALALFFIVSVAVSAKEKKTVVEADRPSRIYLPEEKAPPSPERQDGFVQNDVEYAIPYGETYRTGQSGGVPRQEPRKADYSNEGPTPDYSRENKASEPIKKAEKNAATPKTTAKPKTESSKTAPAIPLCERIKKAGGWFLQENKFSSADNARARAELLRKNGLNAEAVDLSCLGEKTWIVRLGYNQYSETDARNRAAEYEKRLAEAKIKTGKVIVRKVE